jgi:hypothetical protein
VARWPLVIAGCAVALLAVGSVFLLRDGGATSAAPDEDARSRVLLLEGEVAALRVEVERLRSAAPPVFVADRAVEHGDEGAADATRGKDDQGQKSSEEANDRLLPTGAANWLARRFPEAHGDLTAEEAVFLKKLRLGGAELTDEELRHVAELQGLTELDVSGNAITDAGLSSLSKLPNLAHVDLGNTSITAAGIQWLPAESMRSIHLNGSSFADQDLDSFQRLYNLEQVKLNRTPVTDRGMYALGSCRSLRHVELDGTAVTAAGLRELLHRNPDLKRIEARDSGVTPQDAALLLQEFPGKEIVVTQGGLAVGVTAGR